MLLQQQARKLSRECLTHLELTIKMMTQIFDDNLGIGELHRDVYSLPAEPFNSTDYSDLEECVGFGSGYSKNYWDAKGTDSSVSVNCIKDTPFQPSASNRVFTVTLESSQIRGDRVDCMVSELGRKALALSFLPTVKLRKLGKGPSMY